MIHISRILAAQEAILSSSRDFRARTKGSLASGSGSSLIREFPMKTAWRDARALKKRQTRPVDINKVSKG